MHRPWRGAAVGAALGTAAGYAAVFPIALFSPWGFLLVGAAPALFGAVCGARGAYIQAVVHGERTYLTPEALERLRRGPTFPDESGAQTRRRPDKVGAPE